MSGIFLSYRRDDSSGYAGRLFDNLAETFGRERVFMDIETLEPGMDFVTGIDRAIASCGAVIAMIGPNWINAKNADGHRRLEDPNDFIRLEITSALTRDVRVIPVLVHNARMPPEQELPEALRPLCRLQACEISDNRWEFDAHRLIEVLGPLVAEPEPGPKTTPPATKPATEAASTGTSPERKPGGPTVWLTAAAVVILAAVGGAWWLGRSPPAEPAAPTISEPAVSPVPAPRGEPVVTTVSPPEPPDSAAAPAASLVEPLPEVQPLPEASPEPEVTTESSHPEPPPQGRPLPEASPEPEVTAESARPEPRAEGGPPPRTSPVLEPAPQAQPVTVPAPRGPSADELRAREIAELIQAAERDIAELRLTRPADNNAFDRLQRVLALDPNNSAARDGLVAITERYHGLVEDALNRNALDNAQRHLDAARSVDPDVQWASFLQREIDQRRQVAAPPARAPQRSAQPDVAQREACVTGCAQSHEACRADIAPQAEADCLRRRAAACEQLYESCLADSSKAFLGEVSHEAECIGVHANCRRNSAQECGAAQQVAERRCDTQLDACTGRCRNLE